MLLIGRGVPQVVGHSEETAPLNYFYGFVKSFCAFVEKGMMFLIDRKMDTVYFMDLKGSHHLN